MRRPAATIALLTALAVADTATAAQRQPVRPPESAGSTAVSTDLHLQPGSQASGVPTQDARDTKQELERLLDQYPPSLARVLRLDPTLLTNDDYLRPYP